MKQLTRALLFVSCLCVLCLSYQSANAQLAPVSQAVDYEPYTLTISGGVSLGAYEAGVNWVLVRYLREIRDRSLKPGSSWRTPELVSITGASAGNINILLSAITWCLGEKRLGAETVDANIFRKVWLEVGLDALLPDIDAFADPEQGFLDKKASEGLVREPDGILARRAAFTPVVEVVDTYLKASGYMDGCEIPMAVTVTRLQPRERAVAGLAVRNQRHVIAWKARTHGGRIFFVPLDGDEVPSTSALGNLAELPYKDQGEGVRVIDTQKHIYPTILASSAFPGAFGPVFLEHCVGQGGACLADQPGGSSRVVSRYRFLDGGVFDNVPLGASIAYAERYVQNYNAGVGPGTSVHRPIVHLYIDPDTRRPVIQRDEEGDKDAPPGLEYLQSFVGGAVATARNYELETDLRRLGFKYELSAMLRQARLALLEGDASTLPKLSTEELIGVGQGCLSVTFGDGVIKIFEDLEQLDCILKGYRSRPTGSAELPPTAREVLSLMEEFSRSLAWLAELRRSAEERRGLTIYRFDVMARLFQRMEQFDRLTPTESRRLAELRLGSLELLSSVGERVGQLSKVWSDRLRSISAQARKLSIGEDQERRLVVSSRFARLTASHFGNFGAFFDRPMREYDYYAGVYDGLHNVATRRCVRKKQFEPDYKIPIVSKPSDDPSDETPVLDYGDVGTQRCMGEFMRESMGLLGMLPSTEASADPVRSSLAWRLVRQMAFVELYTNLEEEELAAVLESSEWGWLEFDERWCGALGLGESCVGLPRGSSASAKAASPVASRNTQIIADIVLAPDSGECGEPGFTAREAKGCFPVMSFDTFIEGLEETEFDGERYDPQSRYMEAVLDNPNGWAVLPMRNGVARLRDLQGREDRVLKTDNAFLPEFGEFMLETMLDLQRSVYQKTRSAHDAGGELELDLGTGFFSPSSAPVDRGALYWPLLLLPTYVSANILDDGVDVGWRGVYGFSRWFGLNMDGALHKRTNGRWFGSLGAGFGLRNHVGLWYVLSELEVLLRLKFDDFAGSISAPPERERELRARGWGYEIATYALAGKVRLAFSHQNAWAFGWESKDSFVESYGDVTFTLGLNDVSGLLYWIPTWIF